MSLTFIDICSGIGGFRQGFEQLGFKCIGYVEIDKWARLSYEAMYDTEGEWTAHDITKVKADEIPYADIWCFGFPCQDISVAGNRKGLSGERSGIFYSILDLLKSKEAKDRPEWIVAENVKNLLSINDGWDFAEVLTEMDEAGYDVQWELVNSKDFDVPQNRERVYLIGHLRERGGQFLFPRPSESRYTDTQIKGETEKEETVTCIGGDAKTGYNAIPKINIILDGKHQTEDVMGNNGVSKALKASDYKNPHKVATPKINIIMEGGNQREDLMDKDGLCSALTATMYKEPNIVALPCIDPDRINKTQNGRRFKEPEEPMFTLTAQDRHGVLLYDGKEYNIRKLTPKECFRLQGFSDELFEKAQAICSNTQLYKQAGNAVTVNVARAVAEYIKNTE